MNIDEGIFHKAFKYFICLSISLCIVFWKKSWGILFFPLSLSTLAVYFYIFFPEANQIINVYIVVISMSGLIILLTSLDDISLEKIPYLLVWTGVVVGVFSFIEIFFYGDLFVEHWSRTGGMRSISTLFNPNNLGLYLGMCLIFLTGINYRPLKKLIISLPIIFGFVLSGSRTAWVAFIATIFFSNLYSFIKYKNTDFAVIRIRTLLLLIFLGFFATTINNIEWSHQDSSQLQLREIDMETANIRLENFSAYVESIDYSIFIPDLDAIRTHLISDCAYLVILNSFGLFLLLLFAISTVVIFKLNDGTNIPYNNYWRYILVFYLIAGMADSTTNAFPNNQLFFISLGSLICYRWRPNHA